MPKRLSERLLKRLGVTRLRPGQREVIDAVLAGRDVLAILPAGGGKSLCYQVPALQRRGTTVVVSPLISLMKDQADKLEARGVDAAALNSTLTEAELRDALTDVQRGRKEIVFATPERLVDPGFAASLRKARIDLLVVDEAHCISQWGHDFRPAFLGIAEAARALGEPPILALTATAAPEVAQDIRAQLRRPRMKVINAGVYRENLRFAVRQVTNEDEKMERLLALVRAAPGAVIVYAATVKAAKAVHRALCDAGEDARLYHGRLRSAEREAAQEAFMRGEARVLVATNAFGMGIDKPDIRLVAHCQMPGSLEAYYQEAGRAGRDGREAQCVLLYDHADRRVQLYFAGGGDGPNGGAERERVERMTAYAQSTRCRWQLILDYFAEPSDQPCGHCDNCLHPPQVEAEPLRVEPAARPWQPGDAVTVPEYGAGTVEAIADDRVAVRFPDGARREFAPRYVRRRARGARPRAP